MKAAKAALAAAAATLLLASPAAGQTPTFTSRVDAVRVDVLVQERGRILSGLQASDFEVFDNGIRQEVELVTFERLPLKLILALDMSASVAGERLAHLQAAGRALLEQLADDDQVALVTFSHAVTLEAPLTSDRRRVAAILDRAYGSGQTALVDASHAALTAAESGLGRSLVIIFSDGVDTTSWLPAANVLDTARRTDVVVYCVSTASKRSSEFADELTSASGGGFIEVASTRDLTATFVSILDEFRQRYLVSFTPRGVSRAGWHRLEVRVKGRRATVRARPGYLAGP